MVLIIYAIILFSIYYIAYVLKIYFEKTYNTSKQFQFNKVIHISGEHFFLETFPQTFFKFD